MNPTQEPAQEEEIYVLVAERDTLTPTKDSRPIVFGQYIDNGAASLASVKVFQTALGDKYGETRIAKLVFIDGQKCWYRPTDEGEPD
jgi:hypothetical protein